MSAIKNDILETTFSFSAGAEGYDELLSNTARSSLGMPPIVRDGHKQAIRLGEHWEFNTPGRRIRVSLGFLWDCDGTFVELYKMNKDGDTVIRKALLSSIVKTGIRISENLTGRVIGYAILPQLEGNHES